MAGWAVVTLEYRRTGWRRSYKRYVTGGHPDEKKFQQDAFADALVELHKYQGTRSVVKSELHDSGWRVKMQNDPGTNYRYI
jgi:hypothetical protein